MKGVWAVALSVLAYSSAVFAASTSYKCTVKSILVVKEGMPVPDPFAKEYTGQEFFVDRATGRMSGTLLSSRVWATTRILDEGSNAQSFKVLYLSSPFVQVRVLVVNEYEEGKSKNFTLLDNTDVFSGICVGLM